MKRVKVMQSFVNIFTGQVCAADDANDKEILREANLQSPPGTTAGWGTVVRKGTEIESWDKETRKKAKPVPCEKYPGRTHYFIIC